MYCLCLGGSVQDRQARSQRHQARNHQRAAAAFEQGCVRRTTLCNAGEPDTKRKTDEAKNADHRSLVMHVGSAQQLVRKPFELPSGRRAGLRKMEQHLITADR
jgi:hypothetical protein